MNEPSTPEEIARSTAARRVGRRAWIGGAVSLAASSMASRAQAATAAAQAPVLYVSHGAPIYALNDAARIAELQRWGEQLPQVTGIVAMTPHYGARRLELGAIGPGVALYDLPPAIRRRVPAGLAYPTPSNAMLAAKVADLTGGGLADGRRAGFDHTTWMPLRCLRPAADVPVLELAYPYVPEADAVALGARLSPLRDEGILFVASGGMTHNLAAADPDLVAPSWSREFDAWAKERITAADLDSLVDWRHKAPAAELAHPDDGGHYRVLLFAMGLAMGHGGAARVTFPVEGFEAGLSKRSVQLSQSAP
ncbi:MAG TPA: class III extradiol ring-cleavage dioxygenase [Polyangiaceae bacterium]|nr:class III extradiol ring-cleavage dioxygenase [Polyangiaceae bacterium]